MITDILMSMVAPVVTFIGLSGVGYFVFKNDQQNKNVAIDTKFENFEEKSLIKFRNLEKDNTSRFIAVEKDISKNDERIRKEIHDQDTRNEKEFMKIDAQFDNLKSNVNTMMQSDVETKAMMGHFDTTLAGVSDKIDIMFKTIVNRDPR